MVLQVNKEQKQAIEYDKQAPLLLVAGAGTGKTFVITQKIIYLIKERGVAPNEILALTFTNKAAQEMEERAEQGLPIGYYDLWISTFHSFCERVLRAYALDIGLSPDFKLNDQTALWLLLRQNIDRFSLNYYRPKSNPFKFIHALIHHFSRCKDEGIYPEQYLKYSDSLKTNLTDLSESSEIERNKEIAQAYSTYQTLLAENNILDFGDIIAYCLQLFQQRPLILKKYQNQFKYILVDEFQDTNWAQYELIKLLTTPSHQLTVCADDDQCLPGQTKIEICERGKVRKKLIKNIKKGEQVLTGIGKGHIGISLVNRVFKTKKKIKMLTITTEGGYKVEATDNHKMFCFVPRTSQQGFYYVYLMYRQDMGWRIGVTDDLILRLRIERSTDSIIGIKAFLKEEEAKYYETFWSLKYGIPTSCFQKRKNIIIKGNLLKRLDKDLRVSENINFLAQDLNIDLTYPHHCLNGVNRGTKTRVVINLNICYRKYRSKEHIKKGKILLLNTPIKHQLSLETSKIEVKQKLERAGFLLQKTKKGVVLKIEKENFQELESIAENLKGLTQGFIKVKFNIGSKYKKIGSRCRTHNAFVMPAKNLLQGHYIPVRRGAEIVYDKIISIKEKEKKQFVYDLEIDKTHNFIANGVVVHNSIYCFRGACFNNIIQFQQDFSDAKKILLLKNYRSAQNILDLAYNFIQFNNPYRLEYNLNQIEEIVHNAKKKGIKLEKFEQVSKKLQATKPDKGTIEHLVFFNTQQEAEGVAKKILEILSQDKEAFLSDFAILVRANNQAFIFAQALEKFKIPYQFLGSTGLYFKPVILDIISYLKVVNNSYDSPTIYRLLNAPFLQIASEDIAKITYHSHKKGISLYKALQEINFITGISHLTLSEIERLMSLIKYYTELAKKEPLSQVLLSFLQRSGYLKYLSDLEPFIAQQNLHFVRQFYYKIKKFEETHYNASLALFMEQLEMEIESGEQGPLEEIGAKEDVETVKIMTVHSAKGLEFKYVFIVQLVDRRFPSIDKKELIELSENLIQRVVSTGDFYLQEERRLFYVAMTRAKQGLFFTSAQQYETIQEKKPSRFLKEIQVKQIIDTSELDLSEKRPLSELIDKRKKIITTIVLPSFFSFSQVNTYQKCPLQYKFAYIYRIPTQGKPYFSFGTTMHQTLFTFITRSCQEKSRQQQTLLGTGVVNKDKKEKIGLKELLDIYNTSWISEWYIDKKQEEEYYKEGKKALEIFYKDFKEKKPEIQLINSELALEQEFKIKLGDYFLQGVIDRIDNIQDKQVEIIDYKTGTAENSTTISKEDKKQLLIYHIAAEKAFQLQPKKLTFYYLNTGQAVSFIGTSQEKKDIEQEIIEQIEKIKRSDFPPQPGWQCQWCDYKDICDYRAK